MFYPKVCIMQLLKGAWYRVIALFTLYFLVDDTSIMILALLCNWGLSVHYFDNRNCLPKLIFNIIILFTFDVDHVHVHIQLSLSFLYKIWS